MNEKLHLTLLLNSALIAMNVFASSETAHPNILFILADDLGKEWVSAYGAQDIETPHIDEQAVTGILAINGRCSAQSGVDAQIALG